MLNTTYGTQIMNALFNTAKHSSTNDNKVTFPATPYLALFTTMPGVDGTGYKEPTSSLYGRVLLTNTGAYGKQMMATATTDTITDSNGDNKKVALIKNQDLIVFPEASTEAFGQIVGIGVFSTSTVGSGSCMLWHKLGSVSDDTGDFVESPITIDAGEIPIFRIEDFKLMLS